MANITLLGASYTDVPAVDLPQTGGGTVRFYENGGGGNNPTLETEWKDVYSDWAAGYYYDPDNDYTYTQIPSTETTWEVTQTYIATSCTPYSNLIPVKAGESYRYQNMPIHFDSKNAEVPSIIIFDASKNRVASYTRTYQDTWTEFTIPTGGVWMAVLYANSQTYYLQKKVAKALDKDAVLDNVLADYRAYSATVPRTYNNKTVTLAQLDNVTWYSYNPSAIPLNTQLIDYSLCTANSTIDAGTGEINEQEWYYVSDYTRVDPSMTFSYKAGIWTYIGLYDSNKAFVDAIYVYSDGTADPDNDNLATGTLNSSKMPSNVAYVRLSSTYTTSDEMSLIRTA